MMTFRKLDGNCDLLNNGSSLEAWYAKVRDVPLDELTVGDVCRCCRQELFLNSIIPVALKTLDKDVSAGDLFDGELASVITKIPMSYWSQHRDQASHLKDIFQKFISCFDDDIKLEIELFTQSLKK